MSVKTLGTKKTGVTPTFKSFKEAMKAQFNKMVSDSDILFLTDVDKDLIWDTYLNSFPEGTNETYRERDEYECNTCRQFLRPYANVVAIKNNKLISIWDIEVGGYYQEVVDALATLVKSSGVRDIFVSKFANLGTDKNHELLKTGKTKTWEHFHFKLPASYVDKSSKSVESVMGDYRQLKDVFKRSLEDITADSIETVVELIDQNSIYRGEEHKGIVQKFLEYKKEYLELPNNQKDNYCWVTVKSAGAAAGMRNNVIGTLLADISEGVELDTAVKKFESKVAPTNYKRPKAVLTKRMIQEAQTKIKELGFEDSLGRRYAQAEDITVNNVLFADRDAKKSMGLDVFDEMIESIHENPKKYDKVEEVSINDFLEKVLPHAKSIEMLLENRHQGNFMSLISPQNEGSKSMFKWPNNFSWAYNGDVADSMKQRVKSAGGNVDGVLRFSIQWNDGDNNQNDFDAHCVEPGGNLIYYSNKVNHGTTGNLDVDIINPGNNVAVENITWTNINKMEEGKYKFLVHNFSHNGGRTGFTAEIEYNGEIHSFTYDKELKSNQKVTVAEIEFSKRDGIKFTKSLDSTTSSKQMWELSTNKFHRVSMILNSPNHWDENAVGNRHTFFILDECKNEGTPRGFFNEFLNEELMKQKRVFEALGAKMKVAPSDRQLSGIGISSTQKNDVVLKVTGKVTRVLKVVN